MGRGGELTVVADDVDGGLSWVHINLGEGSAVYDEVGQEPLHVLYVTVVSDGDGDWYPSGR